MDPSTEGEQPSREQKVASYKEHRKRQRIAERALKATTLEEAINVGGPAKFINDKDTHETAAAILKDDLNRKPI